jgi:hypothetical protein
MFSASVVLHSVIMSDGVFINCCFVFLSGC